MPGTYGSGFDNQYSAALTAAQLAGVFVGGDSTITSGLHDGQFEPGDSVARGADGSGDGAGVAVCGSGRVLGGKAGRERGRYRGTHRVASESDFCRRDRIELVHDGDG